MYEGIVEAVDGDLRWWRRVEENGYKEYCDQEGCGMTSLTIALRNE